MARPSLTSAAEECLSTILDLDDGEGVRLTELATKLGISKPTVVGQVRSLASKGLVAHEPYGPISLTTEGRTIATEMATKEMVVFEFLRDVLGVPPETAKIDACAFEHSISGEVIERIHRFTKVLEAAKASSPELARLLRDGMERSPPGGEVD